MVLWSGYRLAQNLHWLSDCYKIRVCRLYISKDNKEQNCVRFKQELTRMLVVRSVLPQMKVNRIYAVRRPKDFPPDFYPSLFTYEEALLPSASDPGGPTVFPGKLEISFNADCNLLVLGFSYPASNSVMSWSGPKLTDDIMYLSTEFREWTGAYCGGMIRLRVSYW